jgi:hypothetical protein
LTTPFFIQFEAKTGIFLVGNTYRQTSFAEIITVSFSAFSIRAKTAPNETKQWSFERR